MRSIWFGLLAGLALPQSVAASAPPPPVAIDPIPVVLLADMGTGQVLYARRPELRFVPASVTKVMTTYVAFEQIAQGRLSADDIYTVNSATAQEWKGKGTSLKLDAGARVPVDILLKAINNISANDGSVVLAEGFSGNVAGWTSLMNAAAKDLQMHNSHFNTPNGWPDEGATYVSADDLVKLATALINRHPDLYRQYIGQKGLSWNGTDGVNHDPLIGLTEGADGIKTGYTREAGYNYLGSAERGGRRLVMVIAGSHSSEERANASRQLIEWGFSAWATRPLFGAGQRVGEVRIQDGSDRDIDVVTQLPIHASVPRGKENNLRLRIVYKGPIAAPVLKGTHVADLEILADGASAGKLPLYASKTVSRANAFERLVNGIYGWFA